MKWRVKSGKVTFRGNDGQMHRVTPGETFEMDEEQVRFFRDLLEPLEESKPMDPDPQYVVQHRGGPWYDVIDQETGERINDKALSKEDAEAMV